MYMYACIEKETNKLNLALDDLQFFFLIKRIYCFIIIKEKISINNKRSTIHVNVKLN